MSSNEKGSFDADKLVEYLDFLVQEHALIGRHFTTEQPGIAFIDGCQTHLSKKVVEWCVANHIEILLKLPCGSSLMQTVDCHGGHFSRVKPNYRRQVLQRDGAATGGRRRPGGQAINEGLRADDKSRLAGRSRRMATYRSP